MPYPTKNILHKATRLLYLAILLGMMPVTADAFVQCPESAGSPNTFALCATAKCWTLDNVAYCKCEVLNQESISLPFNYTENGVMKNICDLLLEGPANGFTVSTYATPRQLLKDYKPEVENLGPPLALYTCNPQKYSRASNALSAQCDGGVCFKSTQGQTFPGLGVVQANEIICSCPISKGSSIGFQISGPWLCAPGETNKNGRCCDKAFYRQYCGVQSTSKTGTSIVVGSPTGVAVTLSTLLDGTVPNLNRCNF